MSQLTCEQVLPHMESYHRGDAGRELTVLVDDHLARCTACRRRLAHLKQVSVMLSAWRPMRAPVALKIETAEAASDELGRRARQVYIARRQRRKRPPRRRRRPQLTPIQRVASWLVIAALLFLGAAIVYRIIETKYFWSPQQSPPSKMEVPPGETPETGNPSDRPPGAPTGEAPRLEGTEHA